MARGNLLEHVFNNSAASLKFNLLESTSVQQCHVVAHIVLHYLKKTPKEQNVASGQMPARFCFEAFWIRLGLLAHKNQYLFCLSLEVIQATVKSI